MSLLAGLSVGGVLIGSGVLISQGESYQGHCVASGACGVLTAAMAARFFKTGEFMLRKSMHMDVHMMDLSCV